MKRCLIFIFSGSIFACMLLFPKPVFTGAANGLLLWFNTVIPTLFPFMIISGILIKTDAIRLLARILHPVLGPLFCISPPASFAVLGGFLCGYPMGARIIAELTGNGSISRNEGEYLLSFCNNTSPMFLISFLLLQSLNRGDLANISLVILFGAPVLLSFLFRRWYPVHEHSAHLTGTVSRKKEPTPFSACLDDSIMEACESITKVGGYIIVFSILLALLKEIPLSGAFWERLLLPAVEMTNGITLLCAQDIPFSMKYILTMALVSFGGLCAAFQTQCMVRKQHFSMGRYITEKLITASVTSLFAYFCIYFIR
ncbi:MAG: transporter [Coprococcus sp.]|nr:transporter [Coprococcus sp.]